MLYVHCMARGIYRGVGFLIYFFAQIIWPSTKNAYNGVKAALFEFTKRAQSASFL